jgi:acyl carrier protein
MSSEEKIKSVMSSVFTIAASSINSETSKDNVSSWDSHGHMNLILALEESFGVSIPDEEVPNLTSYPLIKLVMEELASKGN